MLTVQCPFTVLVDSREQRPYLFHEFTDEKTKKGVKYQVSLVIPTRREALPVGDYSIFGMPGVVIERKSKGDFLGSLVKRDNFVERLEKMAAYTYSAVIVEAEWSEIAQSPGRSRFPFKSMVRTVLAWDQRYPTSWFFVPGRRNGEKLCFRMLERFWMEHTEAMKGESERRKGGRHGKT